MSNQRSFIGNLTFMVEGLANSIGHATGAIGKFAEAGEELGEATLVLSKSNTKVITLETTAKEQEKILELKEKYGSDIFEIID